MAEAINMPKLGLQMTSGTITTWYVKEGDLVAKGDPVFAIETDKLSSDVEATSGGTILRILAQPGETVEITKPCCYVGEAGETLDAEAVEEVSEETPAGGEPAERVFCTPYGRKLAREYGICVEELKGTGPGGRIVAADVEAWRVSNQGQATHRARKLAQDYQIELLSVPGSGPRGRIQSEDIQRSLAENGREDKEEETVIKVMSSMRKTIGRRLSESKLTIPHVYFKDEADMTSLMDVRSKFQEAAVGRNGNKLSVNDIVLKAAAVALSEFEELNAQTDGASITYFNHVNLGVAVSVPDGLVVPVIRRADEKSVADISREAYLLAKKARSKKLMPEEMTGGTFTVSNLGSSGLECFQAIINPPESGILAVGSIRRKPVAVGDERQIRPMMALTGSFDHRLIDGALAARFMVRVKELLENPLTLFF